ncbi:hypothetical protein HN011_006964 [Eciton burchellii]|nr:hypothetical protein HN011_006964 [Eciton burchellii]
MVGYPRLKRHVLHPPLLASSLLNGPHHNATSRHTSEWHALAQKRLVARQEFSCVQALFASDCLILFARYTKSYKQLSCSSSRCSRLYALSSLGCIESVHRFDTSLINRHIRSERDNEDKRTTPSD